MKNICPLICPPDQKRMMQKSDNQIYIVQGCSPARTSRPPVLRSVALYFTRIYILQTPDIC